jgi:hypothetical protein
MKLFVELFSPVSYYSILLGSEYSPQRAVALLIETLRYKPEGRGIESR